jgi:hypothetical protein
MVPHCMQYGIWKKSIDIKNIKYVLFFLYENNYMYMIQQLIWI